MDRGYIDIAQFQRLTDEGVCYVTKMKKNLKYEVLKSVTYVNPEGLVTHIDQNVLFTRGELTHEARKGLSSKKVWEINSKLYLCIYGNNDVRTISSNSTSE